MNIRTQAFSLTDQAARWEGQADFLHLWAAATEASNQERTSMWEQLFTSLGGAAFATAHKLLRNSVEPTRPESMRAAASLLRLGAETLRHLGRLDEAALAALNRADALPGPLAAASPLTALHAQLQAVGGMVDALCARHIRALCPPTEVLIPQRLEDFADWTVEEIHQYHLLNLDPAARQALADFPEARVLEASDGRLVALVPPAGLSPEDTQRVLTSPQAVGTFVGGVGSGVPDAWATGLARGAQLANASGQPVAVWIGYPTPGALREGIQTHSAQAGAAELARFQQAIAHRYPDAKRTVVGYSYGTVVTTEAAAAVARGQSVTHSGEHLADAIVLLGSPGVPAAHARQLGGVSGGQDVGPQVYAFTHHQDPIGLLGGAHGGLHGKDPTHPSFGAAALGHDGEYGHYGYFSDERLMHEVGGVIARGG